MKKFLYIILFFQIVVLHDFSNEAGQNILMIGVMGICAIMIPSRFKRMDRWDILPLLLIAMLFMSNIFHPKEFRISTVLYSGMFLIQCMVFRTYLNDKIDINEYVKFIRLLVFLFASVLLLQQIMEFAHVKGFNRLGFFEERWKMNSLAQEPSCLPPSMMLLLLSYVKMLQIQKGNEFNFKQMWEDDKRLWIAGLYTMIGCGTTSGIFITPVFMAYFFKEQILKRLPFIALGLISLFAFFSYMFPYIVVRFNNIFDAIWSIDPTLMYAADSSASARIAPYMFLIHEFNLFDFNFLFGHGVDYANHYFSLMLVGQEFGGEIGIGGLVNFLYDYGLIAFIIFIVYVKRICFRSFFSYEFLVWLLIYSVNTFNSSLLWASILFFGVNKYFEIRYKLLR